MKILLWSVLLFLMIQKYNSQILYSNGASFYISDFTIFCAKGRVEFNTGEFKRTKPVSFFILS